MRRNFNEFLVKIFYALCRRKRKVCLRHENVMFRRLSAAPVFGWFAPPPQPKRRHYKTPVKGKMHAPKGGALDWRLSKNPQVFLPLRLFCGKGLLFGRLPPVARANGKVSTNDTPKTPARGALKIKGGATPMGVTPL